MSNQRDQSNINYLMQKFSQADIEFLLQLCGDSYYEDPKTFEEVSFLTYAILKDKNILAELLLEFVKEPKSLDTNTSYYHPLNAAIEKNNFYILKKLVAKGFDITYVTDEFTTILHDAVDAVIDSEDDVEIMDFLLNEFKSRGNEEFATANVEDRDGNSVLLHGLRNQANLSPKMVQRILDAGCDPRKENRYGLHPIDVVKNRTDAKGLEIQKMIENAIRKFDELDDSKNVGNSI